MARAAHPRLTNHHPIAALNDFLYGELGFHGYIDDYFDPRNSFLNNLRVIIEQVARWN
jgi:regulator of sirC expression with transglutaminase-like and TPR domain